MKKENEIGWLRAKVYLYLAIALFFILTIKIALSTPNKRKMEKNMIRTGKKIEKKLERLGVI